MVSCVVLVTTVGDAIAVPADTVQAGAVPHVLPKLMTHDVRVPPPAVIVPKLSEPATAGEPVPHAEIVGVVDVARICAAVEVNPPATNGAGVVHVPAVVAA